MVEFEYIYFYQCNLNGNDKYRLWIIYYNYKGIKWERAQQVNHLISL